MNNDFTEIFCSSNSLYVTLYLKEFFLLFSIPWARKYFNQWFLELYSLAVMLYEQSSNFRLPVMITEGEW